MQLQMFYLLGLNRVPTSPDQLNNKFKHKCSTINENTQLCVALLAP